MWNSVSPAPVHRSCSDSRGPGGAPLQCESPPLLLGTVAATHGLWNEYASRPDCCFSRKQKWWSTPATRRLRGRESYLDIPSLVGPCHRERSTPPRSAGRREDRSPDRAHSSGWTSRRRRRPHECPRSRSRRVRRPRTSGSRRLEPPRIHAASPNRPTVPKRPPTRSRGHTGGECLPVTTPLRVEYGTHDLDVLLRHRLGSISRPVAPQGQRRTRVLGPSRAVTSGFARKQQSFVRLPEIR
jgi:hypothetical protein